MRLEDEDLAVFAMLLDGASSSTIAQALRTSQEQIDRRAQRIVGRLRPARSPALGESGPLASAGRMRHDGP